MSQRQHGERTSRIAYLTTQYPSLSHSFIRREIDAVEALLGEVERFSIRLPERDLVEAADRDEATRTTAALARPLWRLMADVVKVLTWLPARFANALGCTLEMSRASERGIIRHLAYLVEACFLLRIFHARRIDHVHVHFGTNAAAVARLVGRLGGPSFSITIHGPDEFDAPLGLDLHGKAMEAAFVRVISDFTLSQLKRWTRLCDWPKLHVVRCTPGPAFFAEARPIDARSRSVVAVGRLAPQKGLFDLLDGFALAKRSGTNLCLELVGGGLLQEQLEAHARHLGLGPGEVIFVGPADEAGVRQHMIAARGVVLASYAEGLPVVIMEAFALGRPVIAPYVGGIPELVVDGENGWLFPPARPDKLADALIRLLEAPPQQLHRMGESGRRRTREMHDAAIEGGKLAALLREATSLAPDQPSG